MPGQPVQLFTPVATGGLLACFREHEQLILSNARDFELTDAPRVGRITPFQQIMDLGEFGVRPRETERR